MPTIQFPGFSVFFSGGRNCWQFLLGWSDGHAELAWVTWSDHKTYCQSALDWHQIMERLPYQNNTWIHWISSTLVNTCGVPIRKSCPNYIISPGPFFISQCSRCILCGNQYSMLYTYYTSMFTKRVVNCDTIFGYILLPGIQPHRNDNDS